MLFTYEIELQILKKLAMPIFFLVFQKINIKKLFIPGY